MENFDIGKLDLNGKRQILVLQGVPASGKSTFARKLATEHTNWVIVNRDSMRKARGTYWLPSQESYIDDLEQNAILSALKRDLNVIIDATNLNPKTIEKWNKIADIAASKIDFKLFKISYKEAMERDNNREDKVGEKTMRKFFRTYFPDPVSKFNMPSAFSIIGDTNYLNSNIKNTSEESDYKNKHKFLFMLIRKILK